MSNQLDPTTVPQTNISGRSDVVLTKASMAVAVAPANLSGES